MKLALLSNQWQGVVRRAQQRRGIIDGLIRQWQRYREMVEKLRRWLVEVCHPAEALQPGTTVPLQQARSMLDAVQVRHVQAYRKLSDAEQPGVHKSPDLMFNPTKTSAWFVRKGFIALFRCILQKLPS